MKKKNGLFSKDAVITDPVEDTPTIVEAAPTIIAPVQVPKDMTASMGGYLELAKKNKIVTDEDLQRTANLRLEIGENIKKADALFVGDDKPQTLAHRAWKSICDLHNMLIKGPTQAFDLLNDQMRSYQLEQTRLRQQEQQEAQRKIDEEFNRKQKELLDKAAKAKKPETQQRLQEQAAAIAPPTVLAREAPKAEGISFRKKWKAQITDEAKLFEFICANKRRDLVKEFNTTVLDAMAASLKQESNIPGVRFFEDADVAKAR